MDLTTPAVGQKALEANTTGGYNTAIGREVMMKTNTTGDGNTAVGGLAQRCKYYWFDGNTAIGWALSECNTTGNQNVSMLDIGLCRCKHYSW